MKKTIETYNDRDICKRFKEFRTLLGFNTPAAFAKKIGIKYTTYLNYEKNRLPPADVLLFIKDKYRHDMNLNWLFMGEEEVETKNTDREGDNGMDERERNYIEQLSHQRNEITLKNKRIDDLEHELSELKGKPVVTKKNTMEP